jgi:hypothetical protein
MVIERRDVGINQKLKQYLNEFRNEQNEYGSYRKVLLRDKMPEEAIRKIADKLKIEDINEIMLRWKRKKMDFRRVTAYILNMFGEMGINEIAGYFYNITASCCANLSNKGYEIIKGNNEWSGFIVEL